MQFNYPVGCDFKCEKDGDACVPITERCNGFKYCSDGQDEKDCGKKNFTKRIVMNCQSNW